MTSHSDMTKIKHAFNAANDRLKKIEALLSDFDHEAADAEISMLVLDAAHLCNANREKLGVPALTHG